MPKKARPATLPAASAAATPAAAADTGNEALYKQMTDNLAAIMETTHFNRILNVAALTIKGGGYQAPYDPAAYKAAMATAGMYKCGFNFFHTNLSWSPTPSIPLVEGRIDMLGAYYFKAPSPMPFDLVLRAPNDEFDPLTHRGALECVSPEEIKIAFIRAVARDIQSDDALKQWRKVALSTSVIFKKLESDDDVFSRR